MQIKYLILHHTAVGRTKNNKQFEAVRNFHIGRGWGNIGYHFLIEPDGTNVWGRKDTEVGAHCKEENMNFQSLGICLTGNFDVEEPTKEQKMALKKLLEYLFKKYNLTLDRVKFHRDYAKYKSCPGKWWTRERLINIMSTQENNILKDNDTKLIRNSETGQFGWVYNNQILVAQTADRFALMLASFLHRKEGVTVDNQTWESLPKNNF